MSYLIDTNVLSEIFRLEPHQKIVKWFESIPESLIYISVLTIGEIRKGIENLQDTKRKATIKNWLEYSLPTRFEGRILAITQEVAEKWGRLMSEAGRTLPAIDSLLAATALQHDMTLITRNIQDFRHPGLEVINPWE